MTEQGTTNKIGKSFTWIAWALALALLSYGFNDFLSHKENPNQQVNSHVNSRSISVVLKQNPYGHYVTSGEINNIGVVFLLDTGATQVSIPEHIANHLGLRKQGSYLVETANGTVKVYKTELSELRIGEIILYNVAANINPAFESDEILLGMSALRQIEFRQQGKNLTLIQYK